MNADRRRLLGLLGGVATGGAGVATFTGATATTAGATFTASDVTVRTHDGELAALTVAPAGTVSWSGLEEPAGRVSLALYAKLDADPQYHELASRHLSAAGLHGERDYEFEKRDLLGRDGFSADQFDPDDGETRSRTVRLRIAITVDDSDGETTLVTGAADASFVVTVENRPETASADGEANTGVETETETEDDEENDDKGGDGGEGSKGGGNGDDGSEKGDDGGKGDGGDDGGKGDGDYGGGDDGGEKNEDGSEKGDGDEADDETETTEG